MKHSALHPVGQRHQVYQPFSIFISIFKRVLYVENASASGQTIQMTTLLAFDPINYWSTDSSGLEVAL